MRSPQTTGVLTPAPWSGTFQRTFSLADQRTGRFFSVVMPEPLGPRQPGQSSAEVRPARVTEPAKRQTTLRSRCITQSSKGESPPLSQPVGPSFLAGRILGIPSPFVFAYDAILGIEPDFVTVAVIAPCAFNRVWRGRRCFQGHEGIRMAAIIT